MLELIKMDFKLNLYRRKDFFKNLMVYSLIFFTLLLMQGVNPVTLQYPIIFVMETSFRSRVREDIVGELTLIQSLPVKRREYVISKYLVVFIKHIILVFFLYLILNIIKPLGLTIDYTGVNIKKIIVFWILSYAIIIPLMFLFLGSGRNFIHIFLPIFIPIGFLIAEEFRGSIYYLVNYLGSLESLIIILVVIALSIWVSLFLYTDRDLA